MGMAFIGLAFIELTFIDFACMERVSGGGGGDEYLVPTKSAAAAKDVAAWRPLPPPRCPPECFSLISCISWFIWFED